MQDISPLVKAMARIGASERTTAALANATREADGINLKEHPELITTKSKVHDNKVKCLTEIAEQPAASTDALHMDGKRYESLHSENVEDLFNHNVTSVDENIAICDARSKEYVGVITPERGTGQAIGTGFTELVNQKPGLNMEGILVLPTLASTLVPSPSLSKSPSVRISVLSACCI